jgi:hydroxymethylbilane synthase
MSSPDRPILLATRGSALALAQTRLVLEECQSAFPHERFEIKIIKTTGDKLQIAPPDLPGMAGTKGLFTKELEIALLNGEADLAVHSLKDLPTELPEGLALRAVLPRADVRDVLIFRNAQGLANEPARAGPARRGLKSGATLRDFPKGATLATSSTRRQEQLLAIRPDLRIVPIRGNVGTRLQKLAQQAELDGLVLAAAGLHRLHYTIAADGCLYAPVNGQHSAQLTAVLHATYFPVGEMVPCVGQGAIGLEGRCNDDRLQAICSHLNHPPTWHCVTAERAFLLAMGGGCLSPVAAHAELQGSQLCLRAVSFRQKVPRRTEKSGSVNEATALGAEVAAELKVGESNGN